jgi:hypothetical protein
MGSGKFLQALLGEADKSYETKISFGTKVLLRLFKLLFPNYIKTAADSRLKLKKELIGIVKKHHPKLLIELGSGYSKDYIKLLEKGAIKKLIQIDKQFIINSYNRNYTFIRGDITKEDVWKKIMKIQINKGVILSEGLFTYLNNKDFNFVINKIKHLLKNKFVLLTHESIRPISISRRLISVFIGKTYRRFNSVDKIKNYYKSVELKAKILKPTEWQVIYEVKAT